MIGLWIAWHNWMIKLETRFSVDQSILCKSTFTKSVWNISNKYMRTLKSFIQLTRLHIVGVHPIFGGPMCHNLISDYLQAWFCLHAYWRTLLLLISIHTAIAGARTQYHCAYFSLGMYINNVFDSLCILNCLSAVNKNRCPSKPSQKWNQINSKS